MTSSSKTEMPFPGSADTLSEPDAKVPGKNGLFRLNYFNGRFLTAESMRKEQIYWDYRARLLAEIHSSGIAWGLGLEMDVTPKSPPDECPRRFEPTQGIDAKTIVTLQPGLAFDGIGRPISVGTALTFHFKDLTDQFVSNQTIVVDGGTQFAPCVCLAPLPPGILGVGPSLAPGPYLLVIKAVETTEGEAKIYGNVCATGRPSLCESDGWRGGFALSLARFPVEVPLDGLCSAWDLRGVLSAYYFDVYEHALRERWQAPYPLTGNDIDFCAGLGPFDRQGGAVPLAMVYVGSDSSILFVDPWIPRRPIAATASAAWAANLRGAPTQSACIARVHQFQCQLDESLKVRPPYVPNADKQITFNQLNLYKRGFRHIPPWGFLPVQLPESDQTVTGIGAEQRNIAEAKRLANAYFSGTNVITYTVVAIHEDDILEDMIRAMEKDPIVLLPCEDERRARSSWSPPTSNTEQVLTGIADRVLAFLRQCGGITLERLINREIEVVKLVIPMQGLRRVDPIVGAIKADGVAARLGVWQRLTEIERRGSANSTALRNLVGTLLGPASQPHSFVFYVKQRLVLLDVIYLALDLLLEALAIARDVQLPRPTSEGAPRGRIAPDARRTARTAPSGFQTLARVVGLSKPVAITLWNSFVPRGDRDWGYDALDTTAARELARALPARIGEDLAGLLRDERVRFVAIAAVRESAPGLRDGSWKVFDDERSRITISLENSGKNRDEIAQLARDKAIDYMLELEQGHAGFGALKLATVLLPHTDALALESALRAAPAERAGESTLDDDAFPAETHEPWTSDKARVVFQAARLAYGARSLDDVVPFAKTSASVVVEDVLKVPQAGVAGVVGASTAERVVAKVTSDATEIVNLANAVGASKTFATPAFWAAYDKAAARHKGSPAAALKDLVSRGSDDGMKKVVEKLVSLHQVIGDRGLESVLAAARSGGTT